MCHLSKVHFQNGEQVIPSHDQSGRQMVSFSGDRKLKAIPSGKVTNDKALLSENSLLRDQVERERFRRKVSCKLSSLVSTFIHLKKSHTTFTYVQDCMQSTV